MEGDIQFTSLAGKETRGGAAGVLRDNKGSFPAGLSGRPQDRWAP